MPSKFVLGARSWGELRGVHPVLVELVERALSMSEMDFGVHDGIRTITEQRALLASGASFTLDSRHLTGHAVDLVPWVGGKFRWEWPLIFPMARVVHQAAEEMHVGLIWGGVWDRLFHTLDGSNLEAEQLRYIKRNQDAKAKRIFLDGPHFELVRDLYPA